MGTRITALAPVRRPSQGSYLTRPKPAAAGVLLIQGLIQSIEGLKNALTVQTQAHQPVRFVSSASTPVERTETGHLEVQRTENSKPPSQQVTVKRSGLLDFFD